MAGTPTLDPQTVASLSDAEIDAFVHRVARILKNLEAVDDVCAKIEELLDGADKKR